VRIAAFGLLLLSGCTVGPSSEAGPPEVSATIPEERMAFSMPAPLVEALGDGPTSAIATAERSALSAREGGQAFAWAWNGLRGRIVAGPVYMVNARTCRNLVHVAERGGQRLSGRSTLCLSADGEWERIG